MIKILYIIFLSFIVSNCSIEKVSKNHGVPSLLKKEAMLKINKTNKNEIRSILGNPSTKSKFDNDIWIYIERKQSQSNLKYLGKMKISENNILVLEMYKFGILKKKKIYNKDDMNEIKVSSNVTGSAFKKNSFIYNFMSSMRQKINDPLGKRAKKNKEISQR